MSAEYSPVVFKHHGGDEFGADIRAMTVAPD